MDHINRKTVREHQKSPTITLKPHLPCEERPSNIVTKHFLVYQNLATMVQQLNIFEHGNLDPKILFAFAYN